MTSEEIKTLDGEHVMQTYARFDAVFDHGEGAALYSPEGKKYIDFTSGIGVSSLGYGNKPWADAVRQQALKLQHTSNLFYNEPYARLAEVLTKRSGMKNVFFANAGGEANEGMIKLARKYSFDKYGPGRSSIITLRQSFHGRTITTLAATGQDQFHNFFFPFTEGFSHVPPNDIKALQDALAARAVSSLGVDGTAALKPVAASGGVCAVMVELIQGEGGVNPLAPGYVKEVETLCRELDILLLVDEVQTGVGRTGAVFAYQKYGIRPDVVSFAKGIANGLPMGGFLANEKCSAVLTHGTHATTFGGNPVSAAGALEVMNQLTDDVLRGVGEKGGRIMSEVGKWNLPIVREVRGMGLMIGVSLDGVAPKAVAEKCVERGLLILTAGNDALRFLPPLVITDGEIDAGLKILKDVLEGIS